MRLIKKIFDSVISNSFKQEYLCLDATRFDQPFRLLCYEGDRFIADITNLHQFTGYQPMLFSFLLAAPIQQLPERIMVYWVPSSLPLNEMNSKKDALVRMELKKIGEQMIHGTAVAHFEGVSVRQRFQPLLQQWIFQCHNYLFNRKKGNVYLPGPVYRQVQCAYSLPRLIALISISSEKGYNLFPTDLHGPLNEQIYIDSLRIGGKALEQVRETKKILLSLVEPEQFREVYGLGKNHMKEPGPKASFPFSQELSERFRLPVPRGTTAYWELELDQSFGHGLHQLLLFHIRHKQIKPSGSGQLAHIHSVYGEWRKKQGLPGNYFLR